MKVITIVLALALAATAGAGDGGFWQRLSPAQKFAWVAGWKEGVCMASNVERTDSIAETQANQIVHGLDQFYHADYRNLTVPLQVSALIVVRYAHGAMTKQQVLAAVEPWRAH